MNKSINFNRGRGKPWVHPPEALSRGQVLYNVKFLGCVEVDQPKGSEMVRDAIRKMKFNRQIKKSEGEKLMKVDLCISISIIKLQESKYKTFLHQFPLHQVSYCADDKSDKRMFTFIAKEKEQNKHLCFVFESEKCAEEITLTVGQAFDLAYRRFLEVSSRDGEPKKQLIICQKKIQELTQENADLKNKVAYLERLLESKNPFSSHNSPEPVVGQKLEHLSLDSSLNGYSHNGPTPNGISYPTTGDHVMPLLSPPPPPIPSRSFSHMTSSDQSPNKDFDLFGSTPFGVTSPVVSPVTSPGGRSPMENDLFGMEMFNPSASLSYDFDHQVQQMDGELQEDAQANFSRGLSFGTEDFFTQ